MFQDRFVKLMLVVVALLLAANLFRTGQTESVLKLVPSAQAQNYVSPRDEAPAPPKKYAMKRVDGLAVEDLKDVVSLGDGKTFVVSNTKGFMVYTVETTQR